MSAGFLLADAPAADGEGARLIKLLFYIPIGVAVVLGVLLVLALGLALIIYVLEHDFLGAVSRSIRRRWKVVTLVGVAVVAMAAVGAGVWMLQPIPEAQRLRTAILRHDAALQSEMDKITALIDAERPDKFVLLKEFETADALQSYVEKLLQLGKSAELGLERMRKTARELDALLKQAPGRYREMAELERRYEHEEQRAAIKEKYRTLAEIWEAKAKAAELHQRDVQYTINTDLEEHLKAENVFLERLLTMLNQGLAADDLRDVAEFRKTLQEVAEGHEYLRKTLGAWRERMVNEPGAAPQRDAVRTDAAPK